MIQPIVAQANKQTLVDSVPFWWHSIDLGDGVVTPGWKSPKTLQRESSRCRLPDLTNRSVLDIGAWDGFYSFLAERAGAARVVALDHFVWSIDWGQQTTAERRAAPKTAAARGPEEDPAIWKPAELPGRRGFDLARRILNSRVEPVVADFMETDLDALGTFDVVFFLGVLYHMRHPLLALERLARLTGEMAVIETAAVWTQPRRAYCEFYETTELHGDPTNWWAPNEKALIGMCRAAGFSRVEILTRPSWTKRALSTLRPVHYRLIAHAYK